MRRKEETAIYIIELIIYLIVSLVLLADSDFYFFFLHLKLYLWFLFCLNSIEKPVYFFRKWIDL